MDALSRQQALYTLSIRDAAPDLRVIGAHGAWLGLAEARTTVALLAAPDNDHRDGEGLLPRTRRALRPGRIAAAIRGWIALMIARTRMRESIEDPIAPALTEAAQAGKPRVVVVMLTGRGLPVPSELFSDQSVMHAIAVAADIALAGRWRELLSG